MNNSTARMRRKLRRRAERIENAKVITTGIAIIAAVVGVMWFCVSVWFPAADCKSATRALDFIERCEAHADCKLRPYDIEQKDMLIRKQLRSCK